MTALAPQLSAFLRASSKESVGDVGLGQFAKSMI